MIWHVFLEATVAQAAWQTLQCTNPPSPPPTHPTPPTPAAHDQLVGFIGTFRRRFFGSTWRLRQARDDSRRQEDLRRQVPCRALADGGRKPGQSGTGVPNALLFPLPYLKRYPQKGTAFFFSFFLFPVFFLLRFSPPPPPFKPAEAFPAGLGWTWLFFFIFSFFFFFFRQTRALTKRLNQPQTNFE